MTKADVQRLSRAFKALSNPNRLQLFINLLEESRLDLAKGRVHDCFLANLLGNLSIGAPTVSHHVKELADAGLIDTHREGKQLICSINPSAVADVRALFESQYSARNQRSSTSTSASTSTSTSTMSESRAGPEGRDPRAA